MGYDDRPVRVILNVTIRLGEMSQLKRKLTWAHIVEKGAQKCVLNSGIGCVLINVAISQSMVLM